MARFKGVIFLRFLFPVFRFSSAALIRTASTGETEEAIFTGVRMEIMTAASVITPITITKSRDMDHFHPSGTSRKPRMQPSTRPAGMAIPDRNMPSFLTSLRICFFVVPITRSLPYSCVFGNDGDIEKGCKSPVMWL